MPNPFKYLAKKYRNWRNPGADVVYGAPVMVAVPDLASTGLFQANPSAFILANPCTLSAELDNASALMGQTFNRATYGDSGEQWEFINTGTVRLSAKLRPEGLMVGASKILAYQSLTGPKVTFLPWADSNCTYTYIDPQSELCFTGPLTGCHIYVATKNGFPAMLIHANANDTDGSLAENMQAKDDMAAAIVGRHGYTLRRKLVRGGYEAGAFVWGAPDTNGTWEYHVHDQQMTGGRNRPLPAA